MGEEEITTTDMKTAQDLIHTLDYDEQSVWKIRRELMEKLLENPELISQNNYIGDFYDLYASGNIKKLQDLENRKESLTVADISVLNNMQDNLELIEWNLFQIVLNDSLIKTDPDLKDSLLQDNESRLAVIQYLTEYNRLAYAGIDAGIMQAAGEIRTENNDIATNKEYELNELTVNKIYLTTVGIGSSEDIADYAGQLWDIASQCPYSGGPAVYKARGLYNLVDDEVTYNDQLICLSYGIEYRQSASRYNAGATIYPNPAGNLVTLKYRIDEDGVLEIHDAIGQILYSKRLKSKIYEFEFETNNLSNGVYFYKVTCRGSNIATGKLIIAK